MTNSSPPAVTMDLLAEEVQRIEALDPAVAWLERAGETVIPAGAIRDALGGDLVGHPTHPLLTDLPIGFWTSAFVLDLVGGRRARPAADLFVGLGVLAALPTLATGLVDWSYLGPAKRRVGVVHAAANATATGLYATSYVARRRGHRVTGVLLALAGASAATAGGYLGGHLAWGREVRDEDQPSEDGTPEAAAEAVHAATSGPVGVGLPSDVGDNGTE